MILCLFQYLVKANIPRNINLLPLRVGGIQAAVQCMPAKGANALSYGTENFEWAIPPDDPSPTATTLSLTLNGPDDQLDVMRKNRY